MKTHRLTALLVALPLWLFGVDAVTAQPLHIEGLSATPNASAPEQITVNFQIVNDGAAVVRPFRTAVVAEQHPHAWSGVAYVTTPALGAGETVYVTLGLALPAGLAEIDVRIEVDVDAVLGAGKGTVVAITHVFLLPPVPNRWVSIGPRRVTSPAVPALGLGQYDAVGRLGPIAVDPGNPQVIYVASPGELGHEGCGVWKTTDGGKSWTPIADNLPGLAVAAIAIDPAVAGRVYIAMADYGLFRSDDGGISWLHLVGDLEVRRNTADGDWTVLLINPQSPQQLFLTSDRGVLRSANSGQSWGVVLPATPSSGRATALVMDPAHPNVLYAALEDGVYKTTNGGDDWTPVLRNNRYGARHGILLAFGNRALPGRGAPAFVYALTGSESTPGGVELWRSGDGAVSWASTFTCETQFKDGRWQDVDSCDASVMTVDPANPDIVYVGGPLLRVSHQGGENPERVPSTLGFEDRQPAAPHGDYHGLAVHPIDHAVLFAASDGGIYRSSDRGTTGSWTFIGEGITNAEIYDVAQAATLPGRLIAGTQDNGNILYSGNLVWLHIQPQPGDTLQVCSGCGDDGGRVAIDPNDADVFYVMGQYQYTLQRSADAGATFADYWNGLPDWTAPSASLCAAYNASFDLQILRTTPSIQLASCVSLWARMLDGAWQRVFTPDPDSHSRIVRSARDDSINLLYAGGDDGRVYVGLANGALWRTVFTPTLPHPYPVSDIEVNPAHPDTIYVSFAPPFRVDRNCQGVQPRIYQLQRFDPVPQESTVKATDITGDLKPGLCVNALAIDPNQPLAVYAATSKGVYRGRPPVEGGGAWTWTAYNDGMPPADVRDLEIQPITRHMYAATYGRGAFEVIPRGQARTH